MAEQVTAGNNARELQRIRGRGKITLGGAADHKHWNSDGALELSAL